jgi:hypothetical protein
MGTQNEEVSRALAGVILELRPNGTFLLQDGGIPFEGTYVATDREIKFDVLQIMNRPVGIQPDSTQKSSAFTAEVKTDAIYFRAVGETDPVILKPKAPEPARP